MTFAKVGPSGGFAYAGKLGSAQLNQLDYDHSVAVDGSVAGDTLHGVLLMTSAAQIAASNADNIIATAAGAITTGATGGIKSIVVAGITTTHAGGIAPQVAAGITDGGIATGIQATIADGIDAGVAKGIQSNVADGISGNALGAIQADAAGGLRSAVAGGIQLAGGATDWVTFATAKARANTVRVPAPRALASGWALIGACQALQGPATSQVQYVPLDFLHHGATLSALYFNFAVTDPHSGGIGSMTMPAVALYRFNNSIFGSPGLATAQYLASSGSSGYQSFLNPGSGSAWYNGGGNQQYEYVCSMNNVIDTTTYCYVAAIVDEYGTGSVAGSNLYGSLMPYYTAIPNMAFP